MSDSAAQQFEEEFYEEDPDRDLNNTIAQKTSPIAPHDRVEVRTEERTYAAVRR